MRPLIRTNRKYNRGEYLLSETQGKDGDRCNKRTEVEYNLGNAMACSPQF